MDVLKSEKMPRANFAESAILGKESDYLDKRRFLALLKRSPTGAKQAEDKRLGLGRTFRIASLRG
jgi:hypothetical protein